MRHCHDCGRHTSQYRCRRCRARLRAEADVRPDETGEVYAVVRPADPCAEQFMKREELL